MLSEALRLIRVFHDMKQNELAAELGFSKSYISDIEGGKKPSLDVVEKYAEYFDLPVSSILFFAESLPGAKKGEKSREAVATKVLEFLQFVERRGTRDKKQRQVSSASR